MGLRPALQIAKMGALDSQMIKLTSYLRWFFQSPGTTAYSTTKTGCNDIAEILLKVALNTKIQIQIQINIVYQKPEECHFCFT